MKYIKYVLVLFAFVYWLVPIYLRVLPGWMNSGIYNGLPLLYLLWNYKRLRRLFKGIKLHYWWIAVVLFGGAVIWSFAAIAYNNTYDYSYFTRLFTAVRSVYIGIFLLILSDKTLNNNNVLEKYSVFYGGAIVVCVVFTIVMLLFGDLRENYILMLNQPERPQLLEEKMYITRFSVGGFAGFNQTILASIGGILSYYLIYRKRFIGFPLMMMSFLGNIFYGRIGIILSLIAIMILMIKTVKLNSIILQISGVCVSLIIFYIVLGMFDNPMFDAWKLWLMQPIDAFIQGLQYGQLTFGSSGDTLVYGMYFMPDESTILWGDGRYKNLDGSYYMHTDAGYMRITLYFGIIGALMIYASYLSLSIFALQNLRNDKGERYIVMALLICFFIAEYKGDAYPLFFGIVSVIGLCGKRGQCNKNI